MPVCKTESTAFVSIAAANIAYAKTGAPGRIIDRVNPFTHVAKPVERPHFGVAAPAGEHAHAHGPGARLPLLVERLLIMIVLPADRPEALPATDVVHGIH